MSTSRQRSLVFLAGLAAVLISTLVLLYLKTEAYKPASYFQSLALLRHFKQLNAQWELDVLRSKVGMDMNYDPLVNPSSDLSKQWVQLESLESSLGLKELATWAASREAYLKEVREKNRLVERFKSHNAVLRNSLAFLPTAEDDIQSLLGQAGRTDQYMRLAAVVYDVTLTTMEYAQAPSDEKSAEVEAGLNRLAQDKGHLSGDLQNAVDILINHVRTILREQNVVGALVNSISAVPVEARLDEINELMSRAQQQAAAQDQLYQRYLMLFSAVLVALLLYVASRLMRSYALINQVNKKLQAANDGLEQRVRERTRELEKLQSELVAAARQAGMAEIATNVLHNVGNVLNSVNISADLVNRRVRASKSQGLAKAVQLINEHLADLGDFMARDERGKLLPGYLSQLVDALAAEQKAIIDELEQLTDSVDHIKEIVATQQSYAGTSSISEPLQITDLIEDALRMNAGALTRHHVTVIKDYDEVPVLLLDKHRLLLILINLISNAKHAMSHLVDHSREVTLSVAVVDQDKLRICVKDQGEGIAPENLTRMFAHGYTTRKNGHGFGLHSCALAAMEMEGTLRAHSDGPGKGAIFTLEIPVKTPVGGL